MDRISHLPDDLLLTILSILPTTKDVVETMVLSKRWQFLWMMVPRLVYNDSYQKYGSFSLLVDRSLFRHEAPVIETLHFKLGHICDSEDIQAWIRAADKHRVRELIIDIDTSSNKLPIDLPWSLYSGGCRMLVTLTLSNACFVDDLTSPISFPSLRKLTLKSMKYPSGEFVKKLLSNCHVLENLVVEQCQADNVTSFTVIVPSLKSLVLHTLKNSIRDVSHVTHGFVINGPWLEKLDIYHRSGYCRIENNMTNIVDASLVVTSWKLWKKLSSITSVKRLYLCVPSSKDVYTAGSVFCSLVHLKICTCETEWLNLLMRVLRDSPNLRALKLQQCHILRAKDPRPSWNPCWDEPKSVPECLSSSLKTFEWELYEGTEEEKQAVAFMFRSAKCLKKATIRISSASTVSDKRLELIKDLFSSSRRSPSCELEFRIL